MTLINDTIKQPITCDECGVISKDSTTYQQPITKTKFTLHGILLAACQHEIPSYYMSRPLEKMRRKVAKFRRNAHLSLKHKKNFEDLARKYKAAFDAVQKEAQATMKRMGK